MIGRSSRSLRATGQEVAGRRVVDFRPVIVQLNRMNWRRFLRGQPGGGRAHVPHAGSGRRIGIKVRVQILRMLAQLRLDRRRMQLIAGFVDQYLALNRKEELAFSREIGRIRSRKEQHSVMKLLTYWERKGLKGKSERRSEGGSEGRL